MSERRLERQPHAALAAHVDRLWDCAIDDAAPCEESVLPSGTIELVFDLRHPARPAFVCGPHTRPFQMKRGARESFVGVHFRPGGATTLLGVPAGELSNSIVSLDDVWGRAAGALRERLADAPDAASRLGVLEAELLARLASARPKPAAVGFAIHALELAPAQRRIAELADEAGVCARRFIGLFAEQVGLTPKLFARVRRFNGLLQRAHAQPSAHWARLALASGYYDHAHLARDFREFSALAPGEYLRRRSVDPNHVAG